MQFYLFGVIKHWLGEFCRLEHQFQFGEVDPPTENFIDLIRSKSNLPKENGPSSFHIFHLQCFLITIFFHLWYMLFCCFISRFCFLCIYIYEHCTIWRCLRCSSCCRLLCIISPSYLPRFIPQKSKTKQKGAISNS